jgi:hypothetical protein
MTKLIIAIVLALSSTFANAQLEVLAIQLPKLTITLILISKFNDLDGKLEIEVGNHFQSQLIDDNLSNLLTVIENSDQKQLTLALKNRNNKMYIENTKIHIKITMPFLLE